MQFRDNSRRDLQGGALGKAKVGETNTGRGQELRFRDNSRCDLQGGALGKAKVGETNTGRGQKL